jgi:hypothetical protein
VALYSTAFADRNAFVYDCGSGRADLDSASIAQFSHAGNPDAGNTARFALLSQGFGNPRVCILRQADTLNCAFFHGFSQLFCPYDNLIFVDFLQNPAFREFTFFFSVHTDTYYTHYFEKVNKNYWVFLYFL